ncbi:hypothetical protein D9M68_821870 [compost metagenome]
MDSSRRATSTFNWLRCFLIAEAPPRLGSSNTTLRSTSSDMRSIRPYALDKLVPPQNTRWVAGYSMPSKARKASVTWISFSRMLAVSRPTSSSANTASISSAC